MKTPILLVLPALAASFIASAHAASYADAVLSYTAGTLPAGQTNYTNASAALGRPAPIVGLGSTFDNVLSPFSPHYEATQLAGIGTGGQITLRLENFVIIDRTAGVAEIGVWENVGLIDPAFNGTAGAPAEFFGANSAVVEVSADAVTWYSLNSGAPIVFSMPGAYFVNAGPYDPVAPASPVEADFGKPFTPAAGVFDGKTNAQILAAFDGSAGGTWLDVNGPGSAVPLAVTQIGFVRFSNPADADGFELDAVSINSSRTGAPVPEPGAILLLSVGFAAAAGVRYRR